MKILNFTALDFETMTGARSSACAIGLAKVIDGRIVRRYKSLINPIPDGYTTYNTFVNGITPDMVANSPTFEELWPEIDEFIGEDLIVCHNVSFDKSVWNKQMEYYSCPSAYPARNFFCTKILTGLSLEKACEKYGIDIGRHHDAPDDAVSCARLLLAVGVETDSCSDVGASDVVNTPKNRKPKKALPQLDDSQIANKNTPFYKAVVVYTGTFDAFPDNREELSRILQELGAKVNGKVSGATTIAIVGANPGPTECKKIEENQPRVMYEPELIAIISEAFPGRIAVNPPHADPYYIPFPEIGVGDDVDETPSPRRSSRPRTRPNKPVVVISEASPRERISANPPHGVSARAPFPEIGIGDEEEAPSHSRSPRPRTRSNKPDPNPRNWREDKPLFWGVTAIFAIVSLFLFLTIPFLGYIVCGAGIAILTYDGKSHGGY